VDIANEQTDRATWTSEMTIDDPCEGPSCMLSSSNEITCILTNFGKQVKSIFSRCFLVNANASLHRMKPSSDFHQMHDEELCVSSY
jgi:hypothetical protein